MGHSRPGPLADGIDGYRIVPSVAAGAYGWAVNEEGAYGWAVNEVTVGRATYPTASMLWPVELAAQIGQHPVEIVLVNVSIAVEIGRLIADELGED